MALNSQQVAFALQEAAGRRAYQFNTSANDTQKAVQVARLQAVEAIHRTERDKPANSRR